MNAMSPLFLLATLGVLASSISPGFAASDPATWKCETCPYPKGGSGAFEVGVGVVSGDSAKFGDYTGLQKKGGVALIGGSASYRGAGGYFADLEAADLGLDSRSLSTRSGQEGLYALQIDYAGLPRHFTRDALTPYLGVGSNVLTLPAGYPAAGTGAMPLAGTLQPVDIGLKRERFDLAGTLLAGPSWSWRVSMRRDAREGLRATTGSFFSSAEQLVAPVDQVTNEFEVAGAYNGSGLQASLAYQLSQFRNNVPSLTWSNPFVPVVPGQTRAQLAMAPDNRLEQVSGSAGYALSPTMRLVGDFAVGRLTQDGAYLAPSLNPAFAATPEPAASLAGHIDTFDGSVRLTAAPLDGLRVNASYARNLRDNRSAVRSYPMVVGDLYLDPTLRNNTPFRVIQDRVKLSADYRGPGTLKLSAGVEGDQRQRRYQEVVQTRETTVWGRVGMRPLDELSLAVKLSHGERERSDYGVATWFGAADNPLLRKFNLASRRRDGIGLRADVAFSETLSLGFGGDYADDVYGESQVGLRQGRSASLGADLSWSPTARTQLTAYAQSESILSRQGGSESGRAADWNADSRDRFDVLGLTLKHAVIENRFDIGAEVSVSRSQGAILVTSAAGASPYPFAKTSVDTAKLFAAYKLREGVSLNGSWWYVSCNAQDWRLDGVLPATVQNLLSFGLQPQQYHNSVLRLSLRYAF